MKQQSQTNYMSSISIKNQGLNLINCQIPRNLSKDYVSDNCYAEQPRRRISVEQTFRYWKPKSQNFVPYSNDDQLNTSCTCRDCGGRIQKKAILLKLNQSGSEEQKEKLYQKIYPSVQLRKQQSNMKKLKKILQIHTEELSPTKSYKHTQSMSHKLPTRTNSPSNTSSINLFRVTSQVARVSYFIQKLMLSTQQRQATQLSLIKQKQEQQIRHKTEGSMDSEKLSQIYFPRLSQRKTIVFPIKSVRNQIVPFVTPFQLQQPSQQLNKSLKSPTSNQESVYLRLHKLKPCRKNV